MRQVLIVTSWSDFWCGSSLFNLEGASSRGGLAQLVEHLLCKQGVTGSSPVTSTKKGYPTKLATMRANSSAG